MRRKCLRGFCEEHLRTFLATLGWKGPSFYYEESQKELQNPFEKVLCPFPWGQVLTCFSHLFVFRVSVDNDPHFIIHLPKSQKNICFNINSEPGKILNLVSDPGTGKGAKCGLFYTTIFFALIWMVFGGTRGIAYNRDCAGQSVASRLKEVVISLHIWNIMPSLGLASTREMLTNWTEFSGGH